MLFGFQGSLSAEKEQSGGNQDAARTLSWVLLICISELGDDSISSCPNKTLFQAF